MKTTKKSNGALVLFSGGLDSTTCLYYALNQNKNLTAVSFDYSQRHKIEIKKAIEKKFDVHVVEVRTINHPGKIKSQFRKSGRFEGRTARYKKAIITLKEGEKIELFEQV